MTYKLIFLTLLPFILSAQTSSIDVFPLPQLPERRFDVQVHQAQDLEQERWYLREHFYLREDARVRHGLLIERIRLRDRERATSEFQEIRRMYEHGEAGPHKVISIYQAGVLRERRYQAAADLVLVVEFNESGQEILQMGRTARGAQRKRERIIAHYHQIFELN